MKLDTLQSRLGKGSEATGRLAGSGTVEILGRLSGELDWAGRLVVGAGAQVRADGRVREIEVRGSVEGYIDVEQAAILRDGTHWTGGCRTPSLESEPGAWVSGDLIVHPRD